LVKIDGKGGNFAVPPEIYVKRGGFTHRLSDGIHWSGDNWSVTNNSVKLATGDNKINVIVRGTSNRELETGDVTVYLGSAGEPDLILLSPRDRQVVWHERISSSEGNAVRISTKVRGWISNGGRISVGGFDIFRDSQGDFDEDRDIYYREGVNEVLVDSVGISSYVVKPKLTAAYKYENNFKDKAFILRRGDFVFNGSNTDTELFGGFLLIPYDPDHAGVYAGNRQVVEALVNRLFKRPLVDKEWNNETFWSATQVPKLVDESVREEVSGLVEQCYAGPVEYTYDWPIKINLNKDCAYSLVGHYDGPGVEDITKPGKGSFYCSELAYWVWEQTYKNRSDDFGIVKKETMFPPLGVDDEKHCSILPAFLYERSMGVKKIDK